jgi:gliding motility-associated-like protein
MFRKFLILLFLSLFWNTILFCQGGSNNFFENAHHICYKQPLNSNNNLSNSSHSISNYNFDSLVNCINLDNSSWYKFSTNSNGGSVDILINQLTCTGDSNFFSQNGIEVVFIYADLNISTETFELIENCQTINSSLYLTLPNLLPDKDYYILIDGYNSLDSVPISTTCSYQIEISGIGVKPNIDAGEDIFVFPGSEIQLQGSGNGSPYWYPSLFLDSATSYSPFFTANSTTDLLLTTIDSNGCEYQDIVRVYVEPPLIFYNTITPNNDGKNDFWTIKNIENYPSCRVEIYNKWGQQVYQNIGYSNSQKWDGSSNGKPLPSGTYFYVVENGSEINSDFFKGIINLLR